MTTRPPLVAALAALFATAALGAPAAQASQRTDARAYGKHCQGQSKKRAAGAERTPFARCVTAMSRLARARTRSARAACAGLSHRRAAAARRSPHGACVAAGRRLTRHGNGIDRAYVDGMIPHHEMAVEMARMALRKGRSAYVRDLARDIVRSQRAEIVRMRAMSRRMARAGIAPADLGLTMAEMGMDHDMSHLEGADPFDVAFVEMMIPHHQGAITMSRVVLARGVSPAVRRLARQIVRGQAREIAEMRRFLAQAGGQTAPAPGHGGHGRPS